MCGSEGNYDDTYQLSTWLVTLNLRWRKSLQVQPASKQNHSAQIQTLPCILLLPLLFFQKFPDSPTGWPSRSMGVLLIYDVWCRRSRHLLSSCHLDALSTRWSSSPCDRVWSPTHWLGSNLPCYTPIKEKELYIFITLKSENIILFFYLSINWYKII